ncbi:hypothetical protein CK489_36930 [Bradyrhizobium sp. UFLA03-84]|uniref:hypothetical protein n=1 Tax=Bradyrhizobium sp. UFLA03-84 TaxID=418599 RepID=UPI000BADFEC1|nr:hypothetical protein [Bradyrhizobium sp. UFLA03-84]PAY03877.1 hypothetical protein CK489_36930 [Bradyrhizobium sp. UFLA03-84]
MTSESLKQPGVLRPESVIWYERLAWAAIAVGLASAAANLATLAKFYDRSPIGYPIMFVAAVLGQMLWIWLVARKRQNWARWISLIVILLGIPTAMWDAEERFRLNPLAAIFYYAAFAVSLISVMLLFRGDAREWFARKRLASGA